MPDFEDRRRLLESLKNRLEALLTPKLMSAFYTRSVGTLATSDVCCSDGWGACVSLLVHTLCMCECMCEVCVYVSACVCVCECMCVHM